ncbi:hypothetical protein BGZ50_000163, partial [Haplosporangium sp. Z 11]
MTNHYHYRNLSGSRNRSRGGPRNTSDSVPESKYFRKLRRTKSSNSTSRTEFFKSMPTMKKCTKRGGRDHQRQSNRLCPFWKEKRKADEYQEYEEYGTVYDLIPHNEIVRALPDIDNEAKALLDRSTRFHVSTMEEPLSIKEEHKEDEDEPLIQHSRMHFLDEKEEYYKEPLSTEAENEDEEEEDEPLTRRSHKHLQSEKKKKCHEEKEEEKKEEYYKEQPLDP